MSPEATTIALETVSALFKKMIGPFSATGIIPFLVEPDNIEERVHQLVQFLNANPSLINPFRKLVASMQNKESPAALEEQIRFFNTNQTRNYLFTIQLHEVLQAKEIKLDLESGRLPGKPTELLNFANTARSEFGEDSLYKNLMFAVGLYFDFLFYLQKTEMLNLNGVKFDELIQNNFKKGIDQAKVIARISRHKNKMPNDIHAPIAALLRQLSHTALCLLYPVKGVEFYKNLETIRYTEPLKLALEIKEFGIHSGMVASYLAQSIPLFDPLGEVMSVIGMPHVAHYTKNPVISELASMCELGILLKESFKLNEIPDSLQIGTSIPELKFLEFVLTQKVREDFKAGGNA